MINLSNKNATIRGVKIVSAVSLVALISACGSSAPNVKNFNTSAAAKPKVGTVTKATATNNVLGGGGDEITNAAYDADTDQLTVSRQTSTDVVFTGVNETHTSQGASVKKYNAGNDSAMLAQTSDGSAYAVGYHQIIAGNPINDEGSAIIGGTNLDAPVSGATFTGAYLGKASLDLFPSPSEKTITGNVNLLATSGTTITGTITRNEGSNAHQTLNVAGVVAGGQMSGVAVGAASTGPLVPPVTGQVDAVFVNTDGLPGADEVVGSVVLVNSTASCTTGLNATSACGVEVGTFHAN